MKRLFVLKFIVVFCLILAVFIVLNLTGSSGKIKNSFYSFSFSFQESLWRTGNSVADFWGGFLNSGKIKQEMDILLEENQELLSRLVDFEILKQENKFLRRVIGLEENNSFQLQPVRVIGKDASRDSILINKGSKDGILPNMPVITVQKLLVGKTAEVYENFSEVMLLTNKTFSFDVHIFEKEIYGVAKGKGSMELYIDLIPKEKEIVFGDIVLTAILGGIFPEGLLVGEVQEIDNSDVESFQKAEIIPFLSLEELDELLIINDF
ncbi:MAG: rod shape-determining protein MreC [bacterium]